jgi:hypothetical protein
MKDLIDRRRIEIEKKLRFFEDPNFSFNEDLHVYKYRGDKFDSVTTFLKIFKTPFDKKYWAEKKAREKGVPVNEIYAEWEDKGNKANSLGTDVHKWIEDFWSGLSPSLPEDDGDYKDRVEKFLRIYEKKLKFLIPLRSELRVFSKKWKLAGTIDQLFLFWDEKRNMVVLIIGDWKTNGDFKSDEHPKGKYKKLLRPFSNLYENHHNEYSIQISLYRLILEEELGIEADSGFLCHIGPENEAKIYPVKDLRQPLKAYLDNNRNSENLDIFNI